MLERFWDMFVVDAFIKNPGRSNGNWGVLMDASFSYELAPVYDLAVRCSASAAIRLHGGGCSTSRI